MLGWTSLNIVAVKAQPVHFNNQQAIFLYPCTSCLSVLKTVEVNCTQAEDKQEVKEGVEEEDESAIQNGSSGEEREEMEVEEVAEESEAPVQKVEHGQE